MPVATSDPLATVEHTEQEWGEAARRLIAMRAFNRRHDIVRAATYTYGELYAELTNMGLAHRKVAIPERDWMGRVLYALAVINKANREPCMGAMVVRQDTREVSKGYAEAVHIVYGVVDLKRLEDHAAVERLKVVAMFR